MKLKFDSKTFGGALPYLLRPPEDLEPDLSNIVVDVPRTDFYRHVADYLQEEVKTFLVYVIGSSQTDYRAKRRELRNLLRQSFEFELVDDYVDEDGATQTVESYFFNAKIIAVKFQNEKSNFGEMLFTIAQEDPYMYVVDDTSPQEIAIEPLGFAFPIGVPLTFSEGNESIDIINTTEHPMYIDAVIHGQANDVSIYNTTDGIVSRFDYSAAIGDGETVEITPQPNDPIKVRTGGASRLGVTNGNFDVFLVPANSTSNFQAFAGSNINANSKVVFTYRQPYIAP